MWIIAIGGLLALAFLAIWFGFVPPPNAGTLIQIRKGTVRVTRGRLKPHAKEHVIEILSEVRVSRGFIAVTADNRVAFSRGIPSAVHQRLRNVLLNQWA